MSHSDTFKSLLQTLSVEVYADPVNTKDCIVLLGRLKPMTSKDLKLTLSEGRLLNWIERALVSLPKDADFKLRFSRPWLLKKEKLVFTWDFTIQGNLEGALKFLQGLNVPSSPEEEHIEGSTIQLIKPKRGQVKPVRIGAMR